MPRFAIYVETPKGERFIPWSTIVDAPVGWGMTEEDYRAWCLSEYGRRGVMDLDGHIARAKSTGCSFHGWTLDHAIRCNRAGPNETELSLSEIIGKYCDPPTP